MTARLRIRSPVGVLCVEASDQGVFGLSFGDRGLASYFAGRPARAPVLDLRGTSFQLAVWSALREIPWGEVRTYGEIAAVLGRSGGARAVGAANGQNPVAILVPCHRVVQAGGRLGGFAAGLDVKRWLLAHEAAHAPALRPA